MKHSIIAIFSLLLLFNCKNKSLIENKVAEIEISQPIQDTIGLDSISVVRKTQANIPYHLTGIDNDIALPFNYSIDYSNGTYVFKWHLCDLVIDSDSLNYSHYNFENNIPYKGYIGFEGKLHIVKTTDSSSVTTKKFIQQHTELYRKIYFSDKESIIFKSNRGAICTLYFKYSNKSSTFSIFYKENETLGFDASEQELLDLAISQLRVAKNLYNTSFNKNLLDWNHYKNGLSILDKKVYKNIHKGIINSLDTISMDEVYTPKIDGNWDLVSIIKIGNEAEKLWNAINNIDKNKKVDFQKKYDTQLSEQIAFLRSAENFVQLEYKDENTLIIKKVYDYSNKIDYVVFRKEIIKNKEILMFTGGRQNYGQINSKEMAYFYLKLFENYKTFANNGYK
ncbi:hypothetical protein [Paenimyroides aestuarii]|uniref:Lipoprotein n=1 Tax=Paenimyroides aestuarii TaxID=2968490 RepID=A0ABY5NVW7_9FLAO|nr:hypothetical protein [Paenimyroides aestuarii]UUV22564.1 hypothetical protein NPX36_05855 [Paenimyroides aestuarii]